MAKSRNNLDNRDSSSSDKKKKVEKSSGIQPFLFTPEEWPKNAAEQIIETTEGRNRLKSKMKVLSGNKTPEQLMMYLKNFEDKIYKNALLTSPEKFTILKQIVDKEAQTIVSEVESDYGKYVDPEDVNEIKDCKVQVNIRATYTTDNQIRVYFAASGLAAAKKKRIEHIIQESIYHLKVNIFGNEHLGLSSFIQLKRTAM